MKNQPKPRWITQGVDQVKQVCGQLVQSTETTTGGSCVLIILYAIEGVASVVIIAENEQIPSHSGSRNQ